jgi:hypothetical protein
MARMAVADLEAAVAVEPRRSQRPPEAYAHSSNKTEPVVFATIPENHEMSELRQRLQTGSPPAATAMEEDSSPETSPTLTPTSIAETRREAAGKDEQRQEDILGDRQTPTKISRRELWLAIHSQDNVVQSTNLRQIHIITSSHSRRGSGAKQIAWV